MTRTGINLDPDDKSWLDHEARTRHVPMTELVREAIRDYRIRQESMARPGVQAALETAGCHPGRDRD